MTTEPECAGGRPGDGELTTLRQAIRAFALSRTKNAALADDIAQETLIRMQERLHTLRDTDRLEAWAFQIARNAVADYFRSAKPMEVFDDAAHASLAVDASPMRAAEEDALRRHLAGYVRSVVDGLPEKYRDALHLTEFGGVAQVELARRLGLSVSAAKSRVQRGREMVRAEMERCCHWEFDRYGTPIEVQPKRPDCCDGQPPAE